MTAHLPPAQRSATGMALSIPLKPFGKPVKISETYPSFNTMNTERKKVVGIVKSIKWNPEGFVEVNGFLRFGGTCEDVIFDKTEIVIGMTITEIGLET